MVNTWQHHRSASCCKLSPGNSRTPSSAPKKERRVCGKRALAAPRPPSPDSHSPALPCRPARPASRRPGSHTGLSQRDSRSRPPLSIPFPSAEPPLTSPGPLGVRPAHPLPLTASRRPGSAAAPARSSSRRRVPQAGAAANGGRTGPARARAPALRALGEQSQRAGH